MNEDEDLSPLYAYLRENGYATGGTTDDTSTDSATSGSTTTSTSDPYAAELSQIASAGLPSGGSNAASMGIDWLTNAAMMRLGMMPPSYALYNPPPSFAEGGSTDEGSLADIADFAGGHSKFWTGHDNPKDDTGGPDRKRVAVRIAQQLYGVDSKGNPVFLGGITHEGATPPGIVDEALSIPNSLAGLARLAKQAVPGPGLTDLLIKYDPQFSKDAAARLAKLNQAVQKTTGVGDPKSVSGIAEDLGAQMGTPLALGRLAKEGSLVRKLLENFSGLQGTAESPAKVATAVPKDDFSQAAFDAALGDEESNSDVIGDNVNFSDPHYAGGGEVDMIRRAILKGIAATGIAGTGLAKVAEKIGETAPTAAKDFSEAPGIVGQTPDVGRKLQNVKDYLFGGSEDGPYFKGAVQELSSIPGSERALQKVAALKKAWEAGDDEVWHNGPEGAIRTLSTENAIDELANSHGYQAPLHPEHPTDESSGSTPIMDQVIANHKTQIKEPNPEIESLLNLRDQIRDHLQKTGQSERSFLGGYRDSYDGLEPHPIDKMIGNNLDLHDTLNNYLGGAF